jgi:hypothetical protein
MALFARRVIQRCLDELAKFVAPDALRDWEGRLNTVSNDYVATEWEVALLWAFSRFGSVIHEPEHDGRRVDLFFESTDRKLRFAADIVAISDEGLHAKNPIDRFRDELRERAYKAKIQTGGFFFTVEEVQPIPHRGTQRKRQLLLPPARQFQAYIFNSAFDDYLDSIRKEPSVHRVHSARHDSPPVAVTIQYVPGRAGVGTASYGSYTSTTVKDDNPLFNALKRKAAQLKQGAANGPRGIIVCDRGSRIFNELVTWATFTIKDVIREFFRQNSSVDFVVVLSIRDEPGPFVSDKPRHQLRHEVFVRPSDADLGSKLGGLIPQVKDALPSIQQSPENALNELKWNRSTIYNKPYRGGSTMSAHRIEISARELLDLLSGKLDQKRFMEHFDMGGGKNIFSIFQTDGKMIASANLERRPDEDDDRVILEFSEGDPAVSPFRAPRTPDEG